MVPRPFLALLAVVLLLSGCEGRDMVQRMAPQPERALAEAAIADLQKRHVENLQCRSAEGIGTLPPAARVAMAERVPQQGRPVLLNFNWRQREGGERETRLVYGLDGAGRHAIVVVTAARSGEGQPPRLAGLEVRPLERSFETMFDFRLRDGGPAGWLVLLLQIAAIAVTLASLWRVWRTDLFRRRWLWTLGCLIGFGTIQAPWPTGMLNLAPLSFQLFSAGAIFANPFGPWILKVSVPVVALIVLFRRRSPKRAPTEEVTGS